MLPVENGFGNMPRVVPQLIAKHRFGEQPVEAPAKLIPPHQQADAVLLHNGLHIADGIGDGRPPRGHVVQELVREPPPVGC